MSHTFGHNQLYSSSQAVQDLVAQLKTSPHGEGLHSIYKAILELNDQDNTLRSLKQRTFRWVLFRVSPMTTAQLAKAVAVEGTLSVSKSSELIRTHCVDLIEMPNDTAPVIIAHPTVREFLRKYQKPEEKAGKRPYCTFSSHAQILTTCLRHLLNPSHIQTIGQDFLCVDWTFELYASSFWPFHLMQVASNLEEVPELEDSINKFFGPGFAEYGPRFKDSTNS